MYHVLILMCITGTTDPSECVLKQSPKNPIETLEACETELSAGFTMFEKVKDVAESLEQGELKMHGTCFWAPKGWKAEDHMNGLKEILGPGEKEKA